VVGPDGAPLGPDGTDVVADVTRKRHQGVRLPAAPEGEGGGSGGRGLGVGGRRFIAAGGAPLLYMAPSQAI
jgi:hypothetical protein